MATKQDVYADFFKKAAKEGEPVEMPTTAGGGTFGFVGKLRLQHLWRLWATLDLRETYYSDKGVPLPVETIQYPNGFQFYFDSRLDAEKAMEEVSNSFAPHILRVKMETSNVLWANEDAAEKWQNGVGDDVRIVSTGGRKWAEPVGYNMLFVPSLIESCARMQGLIGEDVSPIMTFDDLFSLGQTERTAFKKLNDAGKDIDKDFVTIFTDEVSQELVGSPGQFANSKYWLKRAQLFELLGEKDPQRYLPAPEEGEIADFHTESENLILCSRFLTITWPEELWVRMELVPNPTPDAYYRNKSNGNHGRQTVPVITEMFGKDEESAREAVSTKGGEGISASSGGNYPAAWESIPHKFDEQVAKLAAKYDTPEDVPESVIVKLEAERSHIEANWPA